MLCSIEGKRSEQMAIEIKSHIKEVCSLFCVQFNGDSQVVLLEKFAPSILYNTNVAYGILQHT